MPSNSSWSVNCFKYLKEMDVIKIKTHHIALARAKKKEQIDEFEKKNTDIGKVRSVSAGCNQDCQYK
jgi:hypothetical protein